MYMYIVHTMYMYMYGVETNSNLAGFPSGEAPSPRISSRRDIPSLTRTHVRFDLPPSSSSGSLPGTLFVSSLSVPRSTSIAV